MTTTTTDPRTYTVLQVIDELIPREHRERYMNAFSSATSGRERISARRWMESHDGAQVNTLQAGRHPWAPGAREVDASRATYVKMDGSRRDYAGLRVISASESALFAFDTDMDTEILYFSS